VLRPARVTSRNSTADVVRWLAELGVRCEFISAGAFVRAEGRDVVGYSLALHGLAPATRCACRRTGSAASAASASASSFHTRQSLPRLVTYSATHCGRATPSIAGGGMSYTVQGERSSATDLGTCSRRLSRRDRRGDRGRRGRRADRGALGGDPVPARRVPEGGPLAELPHMLKGFQEIRPEADSKYLYTLPHGAGEAGPKIADCRSLRQGRILMPGRFGAAAGRHDDDADQGTHPAVTLTCAGRAARRRCSAPRSSSTT